MIMPFFRESKRTNIKKIVTLQVQIPPSIMRPSVKRVLSSAFRIKKEGSLTIEAAMALPLFIFFMILMMMPMEIMNIDRQVQTALEGVGEDLSQYAYLLQRGKEDKPESTSKMTGIQKEILTSLAGEGVLFYARKRVEDKVDMRRIEGISFSRSSVLRDDKTIDLIMNYRVKLPFSVFGLKSVPMTARSTRRAWIGKEGGKGEQDMESEEIVYVGKGSTRYHMVRTCHYLYNDLKSVSRDEVVNMRNLSGSTYKPCSRCQPKKEGDGPVYIMPSGEKYHTDQNCSSIISYASAVSIETVRHLGACSYCSH
jgi:hypothetical protein